METLVKGTTATEAAYPAWTDHHFRPSPLRRCLAGVAAISIGFVATPTQAAVYQALCSGGGNCTVTLANGQLAMPGLTLQKDQILSWSQGGSGTKTDVGMGVGAVVLFGLPGLIGFAAKKHDYLYTVNYVDESGSVQSTSVGFSNNQPADQFSAELKGMTGLAVGEVNSGLQARINDLKAQAAEKARIAALDCAPVLKPYKCSWNAYVEANPSAQVWASKFPQLVPEQKARLHAAD
jgi:hypothetical protein